MGFQSKFAGALGVTSGADFLKNILRTQTQYFIQLGWFLNGGWINDDMDGPLEGSKNYGP